MVPGSVVLSGQMSWPVRAGRGQWRRRSVSHTGEPGAFNGKE